MKLQSLLMRGFRLSRTFYDKRFLYVVSIKIRWLMTNFQKSEQEMIKESKLGNEAKETVLETSN